MLYGDAPAHEPQQAQQRGGELIRGPLPPPPMMRQASVSSSNMPPDYQHKHVPPPYDGIHGDSFAARRMRKLTQRRAVDYTSTVVRYMQVCMWQRDSRDRTVLQPTRAAAIDMLPSIGHSDNPSTSFASKFVHASLNKNRCSINRVLWTPTGRRLITGSQSGEFTLWNGQSFNFEMLIQAHDQAVRSMVWSHNENWMVTGDDGGSIKYWQNNLNNVKANKSAHKESVRDLSFCKTDLKFCSCSDDTTVKVWDFARCQEERSLSGHGWDVKSVDWHPTKSLLASGGKDSLVKFWDAKSGKELSSFHGHKNMVLSVKWNQNGNWLLTASKDQVIKLYEIRTMKELESFRGHQRDVTALAWHPFHEEYFVSGSFDGSILHWIVGHEMPQVEMTNAHDNSVWDLSWHPIGYLLCSGSHDNTTKFWCRNRPGDSNQDKINVGQSQSFGDHNISLSSRLSVNFQLPDIPVTPGAFSVGAARNEGTIPGVGIAVPLTIPSLDTPAQAETVLPFQSSAGAPPLPPGPHPSLLSGSHPQQQYQNLPQQVGSSLQHLQPPSHLPLLPHPQHVPRPSFQAPQSLPGSLSMSSMPMPSILGATNQMGQGHFLGINQAPSGSLSGSGMPPPSGSYTNGFPNVHGPVKQGSPQMHPHGGGFGRGTAGLIPLLPGLGHFQPSDRHGASGIGLPPGAPPLPPGPHPQLRRPQ